MITQILHAMLDGAQLLDTFFRGRWVDVCVLIYIGLSSLLIIDTIYVYGSKKEVKRDFDYVLAIVVYIYFWKSFAAQYIANPTIYITSSIYALTPICFILHNRILHLRSIFIDEYRGLHKILELLLQLITSISLLVNVAAITSSIFFTIAVFILKHVAY